MPCKLYIGRLPLDYFSCHWEHITSEGREFLPLESPLIEVFAIQFDSFQIYSTFPAMKVTVVCILENDHIV